MFDRECIPDAPSLIESMRFMGYSFQSAIADLLDNSISASADNISILSVPSGDPCLIILDDGYGMSGDRLYEAMRYGSKGPSMERNSDDLGRFGLGMKAASLSQCRELLVVSKQGDEVNAYSWNLDKVIERGSWTIQGYSSDEIQRIPDIGLLMELEHGTFIKLSNFDRIKENTNNISESFNRQLNDMIDHLALVFHRYITDGLNITVNGVPLPERDPFLINHPSTQRKRESSFYINDSEVKLKPFILPHLSKLKQSDLDLIGGKEHLRSDQGFYIYRNKRLIIKGTWFRLERKDELNKLARVMVDIPNSLDALWSIDIKKSSATLPDIIKKNLYNAVYESIQASEGVHTYRGRKENPNPGIDYIWERIKKREEVSYVINRNIPQLRMLQSTLDDEQAKLLDTVISSIEQGFPKNAYYLDAAKGMLGNEEDKSQERVEELWSQLQIQLDYAKAQGYPVADYCKAFLKLDLYNQHEEIKRRLEEIINHE